MYNTAAVLPEHVTGNKISLLIFLSEHDCKAILHGSAPALSQRETSFLYYFLPEYLSRTSVSECTLADPIPPSSVFVSQLDRTVPLSNHVSAISGILLPYTDGNPSVLH